MRLLIAMVAALAAALAVCPAPAQSQDAEAAPEVLTQVYSCRDIAGDAERLACYDSAVGALRSAQQAGEFAAVDRERAAEVQRDAFGFQFPNLANLIPGMGGDAEESVELTVERVIERANGYHAFAMTNGQVWVQVLPERASNVRPGATVTVSRAMMGSFMMSSSRGGRAHRVRREQ